MQRLLPYVLIALLAFLLGMAALALFRSPGETETTQEDATLLLERVRNVMKLVTVEGDVNELFNSTTTRTVTLYLPLPANFSFDRKATVEVTGTVLVGYDLEKMEVDVDDAGRTLTLRNFPEPEILAIDHQLVYRNLEESWFSSFSAEDYSALNQRAKERLRDRALESKLLERAREQGQSVIEGIRYLAEAAGYRVVVETAGGTAAGERVE